MAPIIRCCSKISFRLWAQVLEFLEQYVIVTENNTKTKAIFISSKYDPHENSVLSHDV